MTVATTIYENTQARNVYTCDHHAHVADAQRVGGPYRTWEDGALVGGHASPRRAIQCDVCALAAREAPGVAGGQKAAWIARLAQNGRS